MNFVESLRTQLAAYPLLETLLGLVVLALLASAMNWFAKHVLLRALRHVLATVRIEASSIFFKHIIGRLANILPALVIQQGIVAVPHISPAVVAVTQNVTAAFIILTIALALSAVLDLVNEIYQRRPDAASRPIKGYLQVVKIIIYGAATILIIAALMERSPLLLLSGLGALAAVLMLVFKDTLLSLVASVQLTSNDMVRVGDWIEMPQLNADGAVTDVALHTVKVQNWDNTVTAIPTYRLISDSFKNWRAMQESGGRRIMRALHLDQRTIRFLTQEEREKLRRIALIRDYLDTKCKEIDEWNAALPEEARLPVNERRVTNIGTFRAYVEAYLRAHPGVHQGMFLLVRLLEPQPTGIPLQVYCFTRSTAWADYEGVQSDIFDHLLAILPEFELRLYQQPGGNDLRQLMLETGDPRVAALTGSMA